MGINDKPCSYSYKYLSVMGREIVSFIYDYNEKELALNKIINHIGKNNNEYSFPSESLDM